MVSLSLHARTCLCASPYPIYQRKSLTTTSLRLAWAWVLVFERALVFLLFSGDQGWRIQGTIWAQVAGVQRLFLLPVWQTQLWKVWRYKEDCYELGMWALVQTELMFWDLSCSELQKYRNRLFWPHFYYLYKRLAIIYQRGCMSGLVWVPPISVLPSESLFGRFQLDFDVIADTFSDWSPNTLPSVFLAESGGGMYFPSIGTSRNLNSFYCRWPIKPRAA